MIGKDLLLFANDFLKISSAITVDKIVEIISHDKIDTDQRIERAMSRLEYIFDVLKYLYGSINGQEKLTPSVSYILKIRYHKNDDLNSAFEFLRDYMDFNILKEIAEIQNIYFKVDVADNMIIKQNVILNNTYDVNDPETLNELVSDESVKIITDPNDINKSLFIRNIFKLNISIQSLQESITLIEHMILLCNKIKNIKYSNEKTLDIWGKFNIHTCEIFFKRAFIVEQLIFCYSKIVKLFKFKDGGVVNKAWIKFRDNLIKLQELVHEKIYDNDRFKERWRQDPKKIKNWEDENFGEMYGPSSPGYFNKRPNKIELKNPDSSDIVWHTDNKK